MKVILLGTAAGGGFPQWNCACAMCGRAGSPGVPARSQDGVAVSANGSDWYLLNASPDLRAQILATDALRAGPGARDTPLRGVLLTDAELDHTLGLITLREAPELRVWAPAPVIGALTEQFGVRPVTATYGGWSWHAVRAGEPIGLSGLEVTSAAVSGKRPRFAADSPAADDWVVTYRVHDPATGATLVYAPCLAAWSAEFGQFVEGAAVVLLDGTFFTADELPERAGRPAAPGAGARSPMGHLPIDGPGGSLERIRELRGPRWVYTHLNNTNPLLDDAAAEHRRLGEAGAQVLTDGTVLEL